MCVMYASCRTQVNIFSKNIQCLPVVAGLQPSTQFLSCSELGTESRAGACQASTHRWAELSSLPVHIVFFSVILIELYTLYLFDLIQGLLYQPRLALHLLCSPGWPGVLGSQASTMPTYAYFFFSFYFFFTCIYFILYVYVCPSQRGYGGKKTTWVLSPGDLVGSGVKLRPLILMASDFTPWAMLLALVFFNRIILASLGSCFSLFETDCRSFLH